MKVKVRGLVAVLLLALASVATGQERFIRDDAGDTAHQSIDAEGLPIFGLADAYGRLWVNIASGTSGVQTEDVAASGGEVGVYCLAVQQDVLADSVSATGDFASLKVDALGALYIQGPFARDAAAGATAYGLQVLGVRTDTRASLGGTTGDWVPIQFTANGDARTKDDDLNTAFGTATTAAVDGDAAGSAVAHLRGINKKLAAGGIGVTETSAAAIASDTAEMTGGAVTFQTPVAVNQAAAGRTTILALEATKVIYLHALVGTMDVAGTVIVYYDDDGAGTNEVALTGNMAFAATGGVVIPFNANTNACLRTAAGKQLTIVTTGGAFDGYAIVSKTP